MAQSPSKRVLYAALVGNVLVALTKAAAAAFTGSSAMLSEAIHSFVDIGNEGLLLYGLRRAARRADAEHPLGYGRELYFWSFIVALLVFALGASASIYQGLARIRQLEPIHHPFVNYAVLGLAFLFEGTSWLISLRQFSSAKGQLGFYDAFRQSKDPTSFIVLVEDSAALIGILIAAVGTFAATTLHAPVFDGLASVAIGLLLAGTAVLLARESKSLLIGEGADVWLSESILRIAGNEPSVSSANGVIAVHLAPDQILAALSIEFADDLRAPEIEDAVIQIERRVRAAHPEVVRLFVKPQTDRTFRDDARRRLGERKSDAM